MPVFQARTETSPNTPTPTQPGEGQPQVNHYQGTQQDDDYQDSEDKPPLTFDTQPVVVLNQVCLLSLSS
jgi:hypothetical protein